MGRVYDRPTERIGSIAEKLVAWVRHQDVSFGFAENDALDGRS
jgi:hypothetical protein